VVAVALEVEDEGGGVGLVGGEDVGEDGGEDGSRVGSTRTVGALRRLRATRRPLTSKVEVV